MNSDPGRIASKRHSDDLRDRMATLAALQAEAEGLGRSVLADAFRRLGLMREVEDCLASESADAAAEVSLFCSDAFEKLGSRVDETTTDEAARWVLRESSTRWWDYLRLIDSGLENIPDDPELPVTLDAPASIDPGTLFRMLTGNLDTTDHIEADWADGSLYEPRESKFGPREASAYETVPDGIFRKDTQGWPEAGSSFPTKERSLPEPTFLFPDDHANQTRSNAASPRFEIPPPPTHLSIDLDLRETFLAEATDLFDRLESLVLSLNRGVRNADVLHELGRCFHTLKGAAGSVGLSSLAAVIHATEEELENASAVASDDLVELLHQLLHYLEGVFITLRREDQGVPETIEPIQVQIDISPFTNDPARAAEPVPPERRKSSPLPTSTSDAQSVTTLLPAPQEGTFSPAPNGGSGGEGPVRLSSERVDELMDVAAELISRRGLWEAQSETMREFAAMARTCRSRLTATRDIGSLVEAIQADTHESIRALGEEQAEMEQEAQRVREAGAALERISQVAEHSAQLVDGISRSTNDQVVAAQALVRAMQRISDVSHLTLERSTQSRESIRSLASLCERLAPVSSPDLLKGNLSPAGSIIYQGGSALTPRRKRRLVTSENVS